MAEIFKSQKRIFTVQNEGFTLAEVLITLGIIGVVAAITIPGLINSYKAHRLRSQFFKSYSTISQVYQQMVADDVSLYPEDYTSGSGKFYKTFMKYLQAPFDCGHNSEKNKKNIKPCYFADSSTTDTPYKTYSQKKEVSTGILDDGQIALQDGTLLLFENAQTTDYIWVFVDLNGYNNPPNVWGYDLFTFQFSEDGIKPMGDTGTTYTDSSLYCNKSSSSSFNGISCAHEAKNNPDYFKSIAKSIK